MAGKTKISSEVTSTNFLSHLAPVGSTNERVHRGDEREGDVRKLGVVLVPERVVQPPVQLLPERQQQLAQTLHVCLLRSKNKINQEPNAVGTKIKTL